MREGGVDALIVGTDRIAANGDAANKIGTYSLALPAQAHGLAFYVSVALSAVDFHTPGGDDITIEKRTREEVTRGFGRPVATTGARVFNPAFDVTPSQRTSATIPECGATHLPLSDSLEPSGAEAA